MGPFQEMAKVIPEGTHGIASIRHVTVSPTESAFTSIRAMMHPGEYVPEGTYCHLRVGSELMMTDTQMEQHTNLAVVHRSHGRVLIAGLGVGMILLPILAKPKVSEVWVVEKFKDVVALVEPTIRKQPGGQKLRVIEADIFSWAPPKGQKWDTIYFDIWPSLSTDTLEEMATLHRKFGRRKEASGWMSSWRHAELLDRRERRGW